MLATTTPRRRTKHPISNHLRLGDELQRTGFHGLTSPPTLAPPPASPAPVAAQLSPIAAEVPDCAATPASTAAATPADVKLFAYSPQLIVSPEETKSADKQCAAVDRACVEGLRHVTILDKFRQKRSAYLCQTHSKPKQPVAIDGILHKRCSHGGHWCPVGLFYHDQAVCRFCNPPARVPSVQFIVQTDSSLKFEGTTLFPAASAEAAGSVLVCNVRFARRQFYSALIPVTVTENRGYLVDFSQLDVRGGGQPTVCSSPTSLVAFLKEASCHETYRAYLDVPDDPIEFSFDCVHVFRPTTAGVVKKPRRGK